MGYVGNDDQNGVGADHRGRQPIGIRIGNLHRNALDRTTTILLLQASEPADDKNPMRFRLLPWGICDVVHVSTITDTMLASKRGASTISIFDCTFELFETRNGGSK